MATETPRALPAGAGLLEIAGATKVYGGRAVLSSVDLVVRAGEVHGLVGTNGAGKTTLLRLALGLEEPDLGVVRVLGDARVRARGSLVPGGVAGFVDAPKLYPYLTGQENVELLATLDDDGGGEAAPPRAERVALAFGRVRLGRHRTEKVATYSTGMRVLAGLAAALARAPRLLLLDEPSSSLDPYARRELHATLRALAASGVGVLLSSHDLGEVLELCDVLTVLHQTKVAFSGTPRELARRAPDDVVRLVTSDDARAVALASPGVLATRGEDAVMLRGPLRARDEYVLALGREGVAVREMKGEAPSLASFFFSLPLAETAPAEPPPVPPLAPRRSRGPWTLRGAHSVMKAERTKLTARPLAPVVLGACLLAPFVFGLVMSVQPDAPEDTLFGRGITRSGFALPLVVLGFASTFVLPALASVVSGDLFSSEDRFGTWGTLLTRSRSLLEVAFGKLVVAFAFSLLAVALLGASSIAAGVAFFGATPLVSLTGTLVPPDRAFVLVAAAWASALVPTVAFSALAVLVSVLTRSSAAGVGAPVVVGLAMQLAELVPLPEWLHRAFPTSAFTAWHGLLAEPRFYAPLATGAVVSLLYAGTLAALAVRHLARREPGA